MGVTDITQNSFEDSGDFMFQSYEDICSSPESVFDYDIPDVPIHVCYGCGGIIEDQFILTVNQQTWHPTCLRCSHCHTIPDNHASCYVRDGKIYCRKEEYYGSECAKCRMSIQGKDWIRKVGDDCYHLACFKCDVCSRQLATGEQFALHNTRLLCKAHYLQNLQGDSFGGERTKQRKSKRMRTAFNEDQIKIFQFYFNTEQNPDPQELDSIAEQAGVNRRVAQVWFQNARAKSKKNMQTSQISPLSISSPDSSLSEQSFGSLESFVFTD